MAADYLGKFFLAWHPSLPRPKKIAMTANFLGSLPLVQIIDLKSSVSIKFLRNSPKNTESASQLFSKSLLKEQQICAEAPYIVNKTYPKYKNNNISKLASSKQYVIINALAASCLGTPALNF
ncbi:hypothetical protein O6H91_02G103100 [Diphasiastrum complanatum]|uniref:Uncharacterized protein n=1 Tax=Diphasiastrum complanatum TaxID=34168 RepID=A0ACC2EJ55_DIPCM|nr:hypothetical protein O6H91_02G103100 [Diphasiastrum complanatum]